MQLTNFSVLTFDCYGTLIDWESGIINALEPLLAQAKGRIGREQALEAFARLESAQEAATPDMLYPDVLATVHRQLASEWGLQASEADHIAFGRSVGDWPAFPDSAEALAYLKKHYKLVILSNVDHGSFARSNERLGVEFDHVFTAQDIGSYKPDPRNFAYLLDRLADLGTEKREILHVAQSLFHDHVPAQAAGLTTAWIDRRVGQEGFGATMPPPNMPRPDFRFDSMEGLANAHRASFRSA